MKKFFIIILLLTIILTVFSVRKNSHESSPKTSFSKQKPKPLPKEITVTLNKEGFSPHTVTIKTGSAVRWKNASGKEQTVNSDDYPTNRKHRELNFGVFKDGSTVVYTFTNPGNYGYHNHFNPEQKGEIIVTQ